jgi:predicted dehydrogenase
VCDLILKEPKKERKLVNDYYTKRDGKPFDGVKAYIDYRELLLNKDIDAVLISTPDHTHAMIGAAAARAEETYLHAKTRFTHHCRGKSD